MDDHIKFLGERATTIADGLHAIGRDLAASQRQGESVKSIIERMGALVVGSERELRALAGQLERTAMERLACIPDSGGTNGPVRTMP